MHNDPSAQWHKGYTDLRYYRKSSKLIPCITDIVSALRMGHKYLMAALWDDAVDRLRYEFPDKLDEYQERRDGANGARAQRIRLDMDSSERLLNLVDPVQSAGLQRILPALCHRVLEKTKLVRQWLDIIHQSAYGATFFRTSLREA